MNIQPLEDRVIIQLDAAVQTTQSGLYLPEGSETKPQEGTVLAVGPGKYDNGHSIPMAVFVGDRVLVGKFAGTELKKGAARLTIMRSTDILAILTDGDNG